MRGYFAALLAFATGEMIVDYISGRLVLDRIPGMFAKTLLQLIPCLLLASTLIGSGLTWRDVFVAKGDMSAPSRLPVAPRVGAGSDRR